MLKISNSESKRAEWVGWGVGVCARGWGWGVGRSWLKAIKFQSLRSMFPRHKTMTEVSENILCISKLLKEWTMNVLVRKNTLSV